MAEADPVQLAFGRVLRESDLLARLEADPEGTLAELGVEPEARARLLGHGVARLLAYHAMVFGRLHRTIREFMPRAATLAGDRLTELARQWLAERGPTTPYLRDVPREFLEWARPHWQAEIDQGRLPAWFLELCEHELGLRSLARANRPSPGPTGIPVELERGMASNPTLVLVRRRWPVHRLPLRLETRALLELAPGDFVLVGWRDAAGRGRWLELRSRHALVLERLVAGESLRSGLLGACQTLGETLDDVILGDLAATLAEWCDAAILLGGASEVEAQGKSTE